MSQDSNLLIITVEDTNDWVGYLGGHPDAHTPNLDKLAKGAIAFENAYAAAPACSPSRTSTLYSIYPWQSGVYTNRQHFTDFFDPNSGRSIIEVLRRNGYGTFNAGKLFHYPPRLSKSEKALYTESFWDEHYTPPPDPRLGLSEAVSSGRLDPRDDFGIDFDGRANRDELSADWIIGKMNKEDKRRVWSLGLHRPHLPFYAPPESFSKIPELASLPPGLLGGDYDPRSKRSIAQLPAPARRLIARNSNLGEMLFETGEYNAFVRAYLASITYADQIIGRVIEHLEVCGLLDSTIIAIWSDHGWQLGEKLAFRKFTLWERALKVPLLIAVPGASQRRIIEPFSLIDLAPSLLSLLDARRPKSYSGRSIFEENNSREEVRRKIVPSCWALQRGHETLLAFTGRSERYRQIRYWNGDFELYDHLHDPFEHKNIAKDMTSYSSVSASQEVRELDALLEFLPVLAVEACL